MIEFLNIQFLLGSKIEKNSFLEKKYFAKKNL